MKLNTLFLIPFLILSIKTDIDLDSYSIEDFIDYEKKNGLFEIIKSIKMTYGQDVAIISCEELNGNCKGNCKKLVIEYMPKYFRNKFPKCNEILNIFRIQENLYPNSDKERKMQLIKSITEQLKKISIKVRKRAKELGLCKE